MTEEKTDVEEPKKKGSKMPLILGIVLALVGGGGGFFAVSTGIIGGDADDPDHAEIAEEDTMEPLSPMSFVALDPLVISLAPGGDYAYLKFTAQLEVPPKHLGDVTAVIPRVVDVLNGYLRAVTIDELANPAALSRLRAQMLRRVQVVTGEGRVRDLLIMELILN